MPPRPRRSSKTSRDDPATAQQRIATPPMVSNRRRV